VAGAKRCGQLLCTNFKLPQSSLFYYYLSVILYCPLHLIANIKVLNQLHRRTRDLFAIAGVLVPSKMEYRNSSVSKISQISQLLAQRVTH